MNKSIFWSKLDKFVSWSRSLSLSVNLFPQGCCGVQILSIISSEFDLKVSPRGADLLIVAGPISKKMVPFIKRIYEQMPYPKWVIGFGACALTGGPFYRSYAVLKCLDEIIPVDFYVSGCPPSFDSLIKAINMIQEKIRKEKGI
ncbi:MAG: NADH-quinone oxidoreductase subunit NuoB [candidate division WOR-3 bacterium]